MKVFARSFFFFLFLVLSSSVANAKELPLNIAEIFSPNQITGFNQQKLILLDFWATWCAPCRPATVQLEILQEQVKNEIFMVSITNEAHEAVARYTAKHPMQLMVALDNNGEIVRHFNIRRWPYAVLISTDGKLVWQGHPADLTLEKIRQLSHRLKNAPAIQFDEAFVPLRASDHPAEPSTNQKEGTLMIKPAASSQNTFHRTNTTIYYNGRLLNLLAKLYGIPQQQITSKKWDNYQVQLQCPTENWDQQPDSVIRFISQQLNLQISTVSSTQNTKVMEIEDYSKLWDKDQLRLGADNTKNYLIGDSRLQADNITIRELCVLLSDIKQQTYLYFATDQQEYDWDIQFKYDELLQDELLHEFGILLKPTKVELSQFIIE